MPYCHCTVQYCAGVIVIAKRFFCTWGGLCPRFSCARFERVQSAERGTGNAARLVLPARLSSWLWTFRETRRSLARAGEGAESGSSCSEGKLLRTSCEIFHKIFFLSLCWRQGLYSRFDCPWAVLITLGLLECRKKKQAHCTPRYCTHSTRAVGS